MMTLTTLLDWALAVVGYLDSVDGVQVENKFFHGSSEMDEFYLAVAYCRFLCEQFMKQNG